MTNLPHIPDKCIYGQFTACSASCGGGTQYCYITNFNTGDGKYFRDCNTHSCAGKSTPYLTPTLSAWPFRGHWALKSILWETLFLNHLHDISLSSFNSFTKSKFLKKSFFSINFLNGNMVYDHIVVFTKITISNLHEKIEKFALAKFRW